MCFRHVLLYALDFAEQGFGARILIEGRATGLVPRLNEGGHPMAGLYARVKSAALIEGVCKACAAATGALDSAQAQGLNLISDMSGHPSLARYAREGWTILTF